MGSSEQTVEVNIINKGFLRINNFKYWELFVYHLSIHFAPCPAIHFRGVSEIFRLKLPAWIAWMRPCREKAIAEVCLFLFHVLRV